MFEDSLTKEYREITKELPIEAFFLNREFSKEDILKYAQCFYRYFDLCNEQVFLSKRLSSSTFDEWKRGMAGNLKRPAFKAAWLHIRNLTGDFTDLQRELNLEEPRK